VVEVEAAGVSNSLRENAEFWQVLLSAELAPEKANAVLAEIESQSLSPLAQLLSGRLLTPGEQNRARGADQTALQQALRQGAKFLFPDEYPDRLHEGVAPSVLMAWGDPSVLKAPCVGIVGTRSASSYGKACAQKLSESLARCGVTILSGGAGGIDAHAHTGALDARGATVAVLPCGIDIAYPKAHENLYRAIRERGCLISQFAAGRKPFEHDFLTRNTLIAALSDVLVVVEAPAKSGALSTAKAMLDLGRDVLVVPGPIDRFGFRGSHALIREGATLIDHPDHVLEYLGLPPLAEAEPVAANDLQAQLLHILSQEPATAETLAVKLDQSITEILGELTMLELEGVIVRNERGFAKAP